MVVWIDPYRFASSGGGFSPTDIANLVAWYDADDATTITEASTFVVGWDDKSPESLDIDATGQQCQSGVRTIGGVNAIDFDGGGNDVMTSPVALDPTSGAQGLTMAIVFEVDTVSPASQGIMNLTAAASSDLLGFNLEVRTSRLGISFGDGSTGGHTVAKYNAKQTGTGVVSASTPMLVVATCDTSSIVLRKDGVAQSISTYSGSLTQANFLTNLSTTLYKVRLGDRSGTGLEGNRMNGAIGEVLVYDSALSGSDLTSVESYLASKWSISI